LASRDYWESLDSLWLGSFIPKKIKIATKRVKEPIMMKMYLRSRTFFNWIMQVVAIITDRVITTFVYQSEGGEAYIGVGEADRLMIHRVS
jgi:hypothetical protein